MNDDGKHRGEQALAQFFATKPVGATTLVDDHCAGRGLPSIPVLAAPFILDASRRAAIEDASEKLVAILRDALDARLEDVSDNDTPGVRDHRAPREPRKIPTPVGANANLHAFLDVPTELKPLIAKEPSHTRLQCVRLDGIVHHETGALQFVEIQAGDPSGLGWTDVALDAWSSHDLFSVLDATPDFLLPAHRHVCASLATNAAKPRVVHVLPDESFVHSDHACMVDAAVRAGSDTLLRAPKDLHWADDELFVDDRRVDVIVRDTHDELIGARAVAGASDIVRACAHGFPHQNAFADAILDDKGSFALLFDAAFRQTLSADARRVIDGAVLPTHLVDDEVRARAMALPSQWVLKPRTGYGGFGIVVGSDDPDGFRAALKTARAETHVVQEFSMTSMVDTWVSTTDAPGNPTREKRFLTFSSWVIGGHFVGCYARAGATRVVNVHQGGGIAPVVFCANS